MNDRTDRLRTAGRWVLDHGAAGAALLLIVAAFVLGLRLGRPAAEPEPTAAEMSEKTSAEPTMYTCSMHPSVRLPDPDAKCPICFMDLIPVAEEAGGPGSERRISLSEAAAARSEIETAPVARFFPRAEVRLYGKVTVDETSVARLTAYFPGRLERLFVNYVGVPVSAGDHLAEIYSPELITAFEELEQARRAADETRGGSDLVRRTTEDTLVAAREKLKLLGLTKEQIDAVEAGTFEQDRFTIYAPIGGVVTHLRAREGDYVGTGDPIATVADLSRLWLDLEAYESQLPLLRWGQSVTFTVEAHPGESFEGRIAFIEPVVDDRTRTTAVRVAVDNGDRRLKPGMFAGAVVRPRVAAEGAVVSDELAGRWVSPMHPTIVKDGPGSCDICGMDLVPAESLGVVGDPALVREPLVVPRSAVLFTGTRSVVYVRVPGRDDPTFEARNVVLGPLAGPYATVRSGLEKGEQVVVHGAFRVDSAMQIAAKPSMMSPDGDAVSGDRDAARSETPVPDSFVTSLTPVYSAYLATQAALAGDDLAAFRTSAEDLRSALGLVEEAGLVGASLGTWRRAARKLREPSAVVDLESARARFRSWSEAVIDLERAFGHSGSSTWHRIHCPMAFDDEGADWLQRGTDVRNPYFGASMFRCGEVRESLPPRDDSAPASRPSGAAPAEDGDHDDHDHGAPDGGGR